MGFPVYLCEVPSDAVKSLTFGHKANDEFVGSTIDIVRRNERWVTIEIFKRRRLKNGVIVTEAIR